jgi:FolB domain-containing protein
MKAHLGVLKPERAKVQTVLVSLSFEYDARKAMLSDDVRDAVDYNEVRTLILDFPKKKTFHLLEKLHHELTEAILKKFPRLKNLKLKIKKFPFPEGSVEVE